MASFFRKVFLVIAVALVLGVFALVQENNMKGAAPNLADQPAKTDDKGQVLGATAKQTDPQLCKYKNYTDSAPRGSEDFKDILCNR